MLQKRILPIVATVLSFCVIAPNAAQAKHDAQEFFEHCQHELEGLTTDCIHKNFSIAEECIPIIRHLLDEGAVQEAKEVAEACIVLIEHNTRHCLVDMERLCKFCARRLHEMGAHRLEHRFIVNCRNARRHVLESAHLAILAIRSQFDGF